MNMAYTYLKGKETAKNGRALVDEPSRFPGKDQWGRNISRRDGRFKERNHQGPRRDRPHLLQYESSHDLMNSLAKTPNQILATKKGKGTFTPPMPMIERAKTRDPNKYCDFHEDHGHDTNYCRELCWQIEEALRSVKLTQFLKDVKQGKAKASQGKAKRTDSRKAEE